VERGGARLIISDGLADAYKFVSVSYFLFVFALGVFNMLDTDNQQILF